jgi:hypothetical protein
VFSALNEGTKNTQISSPFNTFLQIYCLYRLYPSVFTKLGIKIKTEGSTLAYISLDIRKMKKDGVLSLWKTLLDTHGIRERKEGNV